MTQGQVYPPLRLVAAGLSCGRGGMALHSGLDFALANGQCLLLRGPNGTGKTTLLLTLAGIVRPLGGHFGVEGGEDQPVLHYCGHRNAVKARLSVAENLRFWALANGAGGMAVDRALDAVGLLDLDGLDAGYLSAGQTRRLALARLLVSQRPLWLLDEPTAALDADGHGLVGRLLDAHLQNGGVAIVATHDDLALSRPAATLTLERSR